MVKEIWKGDVDCAYHSRTGDTLVLEYTAWFEQPCMGAEQEVEQLRAFYERVDPANAGDAGPLVVQYPLHSIAVALRKKYSAVPRGAQWAKRVCREMFESRLHNDPRVVVLGKFNVTGVDVSLTGMCPGDMRVLRVPPALGYGGAAHTDPTVPANTEINYEITLVNLFRTRDLTAEISQCRPGETFQYAHGGCTECAAGQFMAEAGSAGREMQACYRCAEGKISPPGARGCVPAPEKAKAPKARRARSAYSIYVHDPGVRAKLLRVALQDANPATSFAKISIAAGKQWRGLSEAERGPFDAIAAADRAAVAAANKNPWWRRQLWHTYLKAYGGMCARHVCKGGFSGEHAHLPPTPAAL